MPVTRVTRVTPALVCDLQRPFRVYSVLRTGTGSVLHLR